jgi:hypothetical protein
LCSVALSGRAEARGSGNAHPLAWYVLFSHFYLRIDIFYEVFYRTNVVVCHAFVSFSRVNIVAIANHNAGAELEHLHGSGASRAQAHFALSRRLLIALQRQETLAAVRVVLREPLTPVAADLARPTASRGFLPKRGPVKK